MSVKSNDNNSISCSFCGKSQNEVTRLIEGPGVYICDSCISFCNSLLFDEPVTSKRKQKKEKEFLMYTPLCAEAR